jgi:hypothetical protein
MEVVAFVVAAHLLDALAEHLLALFDGINLIHLKAPFRNGIWRKCSTQKGVQQSNTVVEVRGVSQDRVLLTSWASSLQKPSFFSRNSLR